MAKNKSDWLAKTMPISLTFALETKAMVRGAVSAGLNIGFSLLFLVICDTLSMDYPSLFMFMKHHPNYN